jgi:hypothetical protein
MRGTFVAAALVVVLGVLVPVSTASASVPKPTVSGLRTSPRSLPYGGGIVRIVAKTAHAKRCTISARPAVAGLPVTVPCKGRTLSRRVTFPGNLTAAKRIYHLSVRTGKSTSRTTVSLAGSPASVMSFTATPPSVSSAGGTVVITGIVKLAGVCTFGSVPTLIGLPETLPCSSGIVSATVEIPSTTSGTPLSFEFYLAAQGSGGNSPQSSIDVQEAPVFSFSAPQPVNSDRAWTSGPSCPAANFCAFLDTAGDAFLYNGTAWTGPEAIDTGSPVVELTSLSCTSQSFCAAVDNAGNAFIYNGAGWAATNVIYNGIFLSVSCTSDTFCVAADEEDNVYYYNGVSWTRQTNALGFDFDYGGVTLSCATSIFCAAVQGDSVELYDGVGWTPPTVIDQDADYELDSVSCPTASFCVASDVFGHVVIYNGTTWSPPTMIDSDSLFAVTCPTTTFCAAVGTSIALTYNGVGWTTPVTVEPYGRSLVGVSCPSAAFCIATDDLGNVLTGRAT